MFLGKKGLPRGIQVGFGLDVLFLEQLQSEAFGLCPSARIFLRFLSLELDQL